MAREREQTTGAHWTRVLGEAAIGVLLVVGGWWATQEIALEIERRIARLDPSGLLVGVLLFVATGSTLLCFWFRTLSIAAGAMAALVIAYGLLGGSTTWLVRFGESSGGVVSNDIMSSAVRSIGRALDAGAWYPPTIVLSAVWIAIAVVTVRAAWRNPAGVEP